MMSDMNAIDRDWAWAAFEPSPQQPWDLRLAAHLFRRGGFGADFRTLEAAALRQPAEIVEELIAQNTEGSEFRATADALAETVLASGDAKRLSAAWVYRLLFTPSQLLERTTLFWHGHFATSADKVTDARLMWNQNQVLREYALGSFAELAQRISQDPAMLIYLDSVVNRKAHPNENFARELMELFCLGEGNYSERDVLELARCFTGWEIKNNRFRKNRYQQDGEVKRVLGQSGRFDGEDGVRIVLEQPAVEQFLALKFFRYFISDEPRPSAELLQPLANCFREHNLHTAAPIKMILQSNLFYSAHAVARRIRSPVELIVGGLRCLRATANTQSIAEGLVKLGQGLFYPPNVKGWDGGRTWINSSTLLGRANLVADLLNQDSTRFDGQTLAEYLDNLGVTSPRAAIEHFETCLLATRIDDSTKSQLLNTFAMRSGDREQSLRGLLQGVLSLPQCQLG